MTILNWWLDRFPRYEFLVEYFLFLIPMVIHLPRRKHFFLRLLPMLAISIILSKQWNSTWASILPLYILRYLILFGLGIAVTTLCFECDLLSALYCGAAAYAAQHTFNRVFDLVILSTGLEKGITYNGVYLLLIFAVLALMVLSFTRRINRNTVKYMANRKILSVSGMILVCTVVLTALWRANKEGLSTVQQVIMDLYDMAACVGALVILHNIFKMDEMKHEAAVIQEMWNQERKQLALSQETVRMLNLKCHDMRHLLRLISAQQDDSTQREIDSIRELIDVYDSRVDTGNDVLNLLLAEKGLLCQKEKIRLNCVADGQRLNHMEKPDLYSLFGNALDNAIEAARRLDGAERKTISLVVSRRGDMAVIHEENYFDGKARFEDGLPVSTKGDPLNHGFGTRSMRQIVERYGGSMTMRAQGDRFAVTIVLPARK